MAIALLSIPGESAEPERTFSGARRTCLWDRGRLTSANIEKIECIGNWLREGHIQPLKNNGMGLVMAPEVERDKALDAERDKSEDIDDEAIEELHTWI